MKKAITILTELWAAASFIACCCAPELADPKWVIYEMGCIASLYLSARAVIKLNRKPNER